MPFRSRRFVVPILVLSFMLALTATSANAETYRHRDATKDVWHRNLQTEAETMAKADTIGDIKKFRVNFGKRNLVMRVWYRRIEARGRWEESWALKGTPGISGVQYTLADNAVTIFDSVGTYPICVNSSVIVDAARDVTTVKIPRTCLNSPSRIKVAPKFTGYLTKPRFVNSYDLGMVKGIGGSRIKFSPWITAG